MLDGAQLIQLLLLNNWRISANAWISKGQPLDNGANRARAHAIQSAGLVAQGLRISAPVQTLCKRFIWGRSSAVLEPWPLDRG